MRAVQYSSFGGPEVMELVELPTPVVGSHEVLVAVSSRSINPFDYKVRDGVGPIRPDLPARMGREFAGIIVEPGESSRWNVGDSVFGATSRDGTLSDFVTVGDDEAVALPEGLSFEIASTLPIAGQTAWRAIEALEVGEGDVLLVTAAAGGVDVFAVQLAHLRGAQVIGTASTGNHDALRAMGATPVSYGSGEIARIQNLPWLPTVALDLVGDAGVKLALSLRVPENRIVTIPANPAVYGVRHSVRGPVDPEVLGELARLVVAGEIRVPIAARFDLDEVAQAFELLEGRHLHGKVVVTSSI